MFIDWIELYLSIVYVRNFMIGYFGMNFYVIIIISLFIRSKFNYDFNEYFWYKFFLEKDKKIILKFIL